MLDLLHLEECEIDEIVSFAGRYLSVSDDTGEGKYQHRLSQTVRLCPHAVLKLKAGDTYFHPHPYAHRLYIRANQANATILLTSPASQEALGGSFQRPSWVPDSDITYSRSMFNPAKLKETLAVFVRQLKTYPEIDSPRLFDVASGSQL